MGDDVIRGGAGHDVIVGGPAGTSRLTVTTVTLVGYGSVVGDVGAQAQILVNGKPVSGLLEFKPAVDPAGYQTFTVSFENPDAITSIDISLANATPGRALHIKDFLINGVAVTPADATNASSPGSFDLYVRNIHVDASSHQDWFLGASTDNDVIDGGAGDDLITGAAGNDDIDGDLNTPNPGQDFLDGGGELFFHCALEREPCLLHRVAFSGVDQRPFDLGVDVLQEGDHVIALNDGPRGVWATTVVLVVETADRVRDRERAPPVARRLDSVLLHSLSWPAPRDPASGRRKERKERPGGR